MTAAAATAPHADRHVHTRGAALAFTVKALLFRLDRRRRDLLDRSVARHRPAVALAAAPVVAESRTPLWNLASASERRLVAGKIQNLRIALRRIDGVVIPAGQVFSFWAQIGRPSARRGYVAGREVREGCVIPSVGGGLCQLSNALYDAALKAGFAIVERHAHTVVVPGSLAEIGRDATVFWNYVDLRFRAAGAFRIEADMDADHLIVRLRAETPAVPAVAPAAAPGKGSGDGPHNCLTCNVVQCFRAEKPVPAAVPQTAFLLDAVTPEFDAYVRGLARPVDTLFIPLDGRRLGKPNYAWSTEFFGAVRTATLATLLRALKSRRLAAQGAARQQALLDSAARLARSYARRLDAEATHLMIAQNLLPFLWRDGHLKGRTFDVLMTATPMAALQARLDRVAALHPDCRTLGDFRADPALVAAETAALARARKIVTAHADIAMQFPLKAVQLEWSAPGAPAPAPVSETVAAGAAKPLIVFPASTLGRKGAYELRSALRGLPVRIALMGPDLEGGDFWHGFDVVRRRYTENWLADAAAVVLPAHVEHNPRALLRARAAGVPVIASRECGIPSGPGIATAPAGNAGALRAALRALLPNPRVPLALAA